MTVKPIVVDVPVRLGAILPILACPSCMGQLRAENESVRCIQCARAFPVRGGVPILLPEEMQEPGVGTVSVDDPVSKHPYSPAALEIIHANADGWVLDLGAGGKLSRFDNVIQLDIFRYPMTDVVGTADRLPFRDNAFRAVVSQAVFEHLQYPEWAAAEIRRVLQPHGIAKIDTAFLQPEHGYPHHFFNATETGLRHWFREFDIEWSGVEAYQHPKWSLSWFLGVYLDRVDGVAAAVLRATTLEQLIGALQRSGGASAIDDVDAKIINALDQLPVHAQRILAAGVSVNVINPAKVANLQQTAPGQAADAARFDGIDADRKLSSLREESEALRAQQSALREQHVLLMDKARYLAQFYPGRVSLAQLGMRAWLQFRLVALLRATLPQSAWFHLRHAVMRRRHPGAEGQLVGGLPRPFLSILVEPTDALALTDTFFSLVRQTYSSWELILLETVQQSTAVRQAMRDFSRLDERVRVVAAALDENARFDWVMSHAKGEFRLLLPEGAMLTFDAIRQCVTLARNRPGTRRIKADIERVAAERGYALRCYTASAEPELPGDEQKNSWFSLWNESTFSGDMEPSEGKRSPFFDEVAHIPQVLFRFSKYE